MLKHNVSNQFKRKTSKTKPFSAGFLKTNKIKTGFFKSANKNPIYKPHQVLKITEEIKSKYLPFHKNILGSLTSTSQKFWIEYLRKIVPITYPKRKKNKKAKFWFKFKYEFVIKRRNKVINAKRGRKFFSFRLKDKTKLKLIFRHFMNERFLNLKFKRFKIEWLRFKLSGNVQSFFCFIELRLDRILIRTHLAWNIYTARLSVKEGKVRINSKKVYNYNNHLTVGDKLSINKKYWRGHVKLWAIRKIRHKKYPTAWNHLVVDIFTGTVILINVPLKKEIRNKNRNETWLKAKTIRILVNSFF